MPFLLHNLVPVCKSVSKSDIEKNQGDKKTKKLFSKSYDLLQRLSRIDMIRPQQGKQALPELNEGKCVFAQTPFVSGKIFLQLCNT